MGWSTRELAELAGTSLRSVRHYHEVGLLPEPERRSNGYKQYGVAHLVRLLRIKRLADLGFSLPQIADLGDGDEHPAVELRALDDDLTGQIETLRQRQAELAQLLEQSVPMDLPADLAGAIDADLSPADRSLVAVLGRTLGEQGREVYASLLSAHDTDSALSSEFENLDPEADDGTRDRLAALFAERLLPSVVEEPRLATFAADAPGGVPRYLRTMQQAMEDLYNPAQLDVLRRMTVLFREKWTPPGTTPAPPSPTS